MSPIIEDLELCLQEELWITYWRCSFYFIIICWWYGYLNKELQNQLYTVFTYCEKWIIIVNADKNQIRRI